MKQIPESELILNRDGSVYHLNLTPDDIAHTIINVGDPDRVSKVSAFFDQVELKKRKREFVTHTGFYKNMRITVLSTGIGTDNIDIVYNELDALVNVDLEQRTIKEVKTSLNLIRIGTSGALQQDIPVDGFVCSSYGLGLDGLLNFYQLENDPEEAGIISAFRNHYPSGGIFPESYLTRAGKSLYDQLSPGMISGITASCPGFYGPQGRIVRLDLARKDMIEKLNTFGFRGHRITNFEMETGAMYGLARLLGHQCCSVNLIVANRIIQKYSENAEAAMDELILTVLDRLVSK
jgi:uridine phosphorylase